MKNCRIEIKWAIIFAVMTLVWIFSEKLLGLHDEHIDQHPIVTNFIAIPAVLIYVLALLDKRRKSYSGTMSYKQGFVTGLIITLFIMVLSFFTQFIVSTFITPEYFPNAIKYAVSEGMMKQEDAENYFNMKNYLVQSIIGAAIMGLLTTAIVAIFTRRKNVN